MDELSRMRYNATDDDFFKNSTNGTSLSASNPLSNCLPSSLNLTNDCLATADLSARFNASIATYDGSSLNSLGKDIRQILPSTYQNASLLNLLDYWTALRNVPSTGPLLLNTTRACNSTGRLAIPYSVSAFTTNCTATGNYWARFVYGKTFNSPQNGDLYGLLRSTMSERYGGLLNSTLAIAMSGKPISDPQVQGMISEAAIQCAPAACQALDYSGNADVGGIGALATYASIAGITSAACVFCFYYTFTTHGRSESSRRGRNAAIGASVTFWDMVAFFSIMASIACNIYIYIAQSIYEVALSSLVAFLLFFASLSLAMLNLYPREILGDDRKFRAWVQYLAAVAGITTIGPSIVRMYTLPKSSKAYQDMPCYAAGVWPKTFVFISAFALVGLYCWYLVFLASWITCARHLRSCKDQPLAVQARARDRVYRINGSILIVFYFVAHIFLWIDFGFIIYVRQRSRNAFGTSYGDDQIGYGQIIASGFCLQAVLQYLHMLAWPRKSDGQIDNEERISALKKMLTIGSEQARPAALDGECTLSGGKSTWHNIIRAFGAWGDGESSGKKT